MLLNLRSRLALLFCYYINRQQLCINALIVNARAAAVDSMCIHVVNRFNFQHALSLAKLASRLKIIIGPDSWSLHYSKLASHPASL